MKGWQDDRDWVVTDCGIGGLKMNAQVMDLLEEAKKLTPDQRIELADLLYADTVTPDPEWEAAWAKEAQSRIEAYRRGEIEAVDADEMHAQIEAEFGLK
jgi:hypothetical protein